MALSLKIQEAALELMNERVKWKRGLLPTRAVWVYCKCMVNFPACFMEEISLTLF